MPAPRRNYVGWKQRTCRHKHGIYTNREDGQKRTQPVTHDEYVLVLELVLCLTTSGLSSVAWFAWLLQEGRLQVDKPTHTFGSSAKSPQHFGKAKAENWLYCRVYTVNSHHNPYSPYSLCRW